MDAAAITARVDKLNPKGKTPITAAVQAAADAPRTTLATRAVDVVPNQGSLQAPDEVAAGSRFEVTWSGPNHEGDYVTVVPLGEAEGRYGVYVYTADGTPAELRAPDVPGDYELRYVTGQTAATLARRALTVAPVAATLVAQNEVKAGEAIELSWTGPANGGDYITVVKAGAKQGSYGDYAYLRDGSPLTLNALDEPGDYELRYVTGQSALTLTTRPVTVSQ